MEVYVPEETSGCRYHVWRLVTSPPFENFIMLLIVLNTALLMMKVCIDIYDIYKKVPPAHVIHWCNKGHNFLDTGPQKHLKTFLCDVL